MGQMPSGGNMLVVGGGYFLQQPIFVRDLAALMLSARGDERAYCPASGPHSGEAPTGVGM